MSVAELLGWARSLLESLGLLNVILACAIVSVAFTVMNKFFRD